MGRPPLADGKARTIVFTLRLSLEEQDAVVAAAARSGEPVTRWAREILTRAAGLRHAVD
jgi:hypothetical protein